MQRDQVSLRVAHVGGALVEHLDALDGLDVPRGRPPRAASIGAQERVDGDGDGVVALGCADGAGWRDVVLDVRGRMLLRGWDRRNRARFF